MNLHIGQKALITCDHWFYAPDGKQYRAVFGTVKAVRSSEETLGVRTNAKSTNWYVEIGCVTLAGCQIHYAVRTDHCHLGQVIEGANDSNGIEQKGERDSRIFDADAAITPQTTRQPTTP